MNYNDSNFKRLLKSFSLTIPDRVPILEFWPQSQKIIEFILERPLGYKIESAARGETGSVFVDDAIEFAQRIGMDAIGVDFVWWPGQIFKKSENGAEHYVDGKIKNWNDIKLLEKPPDLSKNLKILNYYLKKVKNTNIGVYPILNAFFNPTYLATGLNQFGLLLYDDLKFIEYLMDIFLEYQIKNVIALSMIKEISFVFFDDDIAFKSGLFVRKDKFLDLYFERMKRLLRPLKENHKLIAVHTDGNLGEILPIFTELGINAIHPVEPMSNDIYKIKEKYGNKICLCGNIDLALLTNASKEEIKKDVIEHLNYLKTGGGYVCGTSSSLYDGLPPENYTELVKTVHNYGYY